MANKCTHFLESTLQGLTNLKMPLNWFALPPFSVYSPVNNSGNWLLCCVRFGVIGKEATVRKYRTVQESDQLSAISGQLKNRCPNSDIGINSITYYPHSPSLWPRRGWNHIWMSVDGPLINICCHNAPHAFIAALNIFQNNFLHIYKNIMQPIVF